MENWKKEGIENNLRKLGKYRNQMINALGRQDGMQDATEWLYLIKLTVETLETLMDES
jgi:hypothetical protein